MVTQHIDEPILELGSVPYFLTYLLSNSGIDIIATDIDPTRGKGVQKSAGFDVVRCDVEMPLPFNDDTFSGVLLTEVLEHLRINPIVTLSEIYRVLKPEGRLLVTTPNLLSVSNFESFLVTGKINDPYTQFSKLEAVGHMGHVREYTPAEVQSLLKNTGFETIYSGTENWINDSWKDRSLIRNLGLGLSILVPHIRQYQIHIVTPTDKIDSESK